MVKIIVTLPNWVQVYVIPHKEYMNGLKIKVVKNPIVTLDILSSMLCFFDCIMLFFLFSCYLFRGFWFW